jgi:uracil-DNA glycosylase family 4
MHNHEHKKHFCGELRNLCVWLEVLQHTRIEFLPSSFHSISNSPSNDTSNITVIRNQCATKSERLKLLYEKYKSCKACGLGSSRLNFVFGAGLPNTKLMFIGEAPGYEEDHQGVPFVGRAGKLLTQVLSEVKIPREKVYITNVVKCHPMIDPTDPEKMGNDRQPTTEEINKCLPILIEQIRIIRPVVICTLGTVATYTMLRDVQYNLSLTELRGKKYVVEIEGEKFAVVPTYHPAAVLRNMSLKTYMLRDLKFVLTLLK